MESIYDTYNLTR